MVITQTDTTTSVPQLWFDRPEPLMLQTASNQPPLTCDTRRGRSRPPCQMGENEGDAVVH